jgi:nicotinate-nucleotide adenylyltransferase
MIKIGLLGGSFNPAHQGHIDVTQAALKRFGLDRVWWVVSPGNPLKSDAPAPIADRIDYAQRLITDPRVTVSDIEAKIGTVYTAQTLEYLIHHHRHVQFVWLMGADNLIQLDRWKEWHWIMQNIPLGILARPGSRLAPRVAKAARIYASHRIPARAAHRLADGPAPRWCYVNMPLNFTSSTRLRQTGE